MTPKVIIFRQNVIIIFFLSRNNTLGKKVIDKIISITFYRIISTIIINQKAIYSFVILIFLFRVLDSFTRVSTYTSIKLLLSYRSVQSYWFLIKDSTVDFDVKISLMFEDRAISYKNHKEFYYINIILFLFHI